MSLKETRRNEPSFLWRSSLRRHLRYVRVGVCVFAIRAQFLLVDDKLLTRTLVCPIGARIRVTPVCATVVDGPRRTGDGYYECVVHDPEGNRIEITAG